VLGTRSQLKNPKSVALFGGALFVADLSNRVRRLDLTTGIVTTVAGTGVVGYSGDGGSALAARLNSPQRIAIDSVGNIYIADSGNNRVRRVDAQTGVITTVAGRGVAGFGGDGGLGTAALLRKPRGVALDGDDTVYIADSGNHRIRKLDLSTSIISTVAGGPSGFSGDGGPASAARFYNPRGLTVDDQGRLIIADTFNSVVRVITPS
jgi:sugar lactone lactonase YvrE